jgi:hypothetical protein
MMPNVQVNMSSGANNSNSWMRWSEEKNMLAQVILHDFQTSDGLSQYRNNSK